MTNPSLDGETVESVGRTILDEPQSIVDGDDMSFIYASKVWARIPPRGLTVTAERSRVVCKPWI